MAQVFAVIPLEHGPEGGGGGAETSGSDGCDSSLIASPYPKRPQDSDENIAPNLEPHVWRGG